MDTNGNSEDVELFKREAAAYEERFWLQNRKADIIEDATADDVQNVLWDRSYSSVIMIGHGALPYVYMRNEFRPHRTNDNKVVPGNRVDWRDVADMAEHLKLGVFIQRHCGNYARRLSVPLGAFAMSSHRNVLAPVGSYFNPASLTDSENRRVRSVSPSWRLGYDFVKDTFDYQEFLAEQAAADNEAAEIAGDEALQTG